MTFKHFRYLQMNTIEIIGPPGAGKTSLCLSLQQSLNRSGVPNSLIIGKKEFPGYCNRRSDWSSSKALLAMTQASAKGFWQSNILFPLLLHPYAQGTRLSHPAYRRIYRLAFTQTCRQIYLMQAMPANSLGFFDPGYLMRYLNGYLYSTSKPCHSSIKKYIERISIPSLLIVLNIDPNIALTRLKHRDRGSPKRMRQIKCDQWPNLVHQGNIASEIISQELDKADGKVIYFDSSSLKVDEIARRVMPFLFTMSNTVQS